MKTCDYHPIAETTDSGKMLFECSRCKHRSPAPTRKRCGKCPACGHHWGTLGHVLNCTELTDDERDALAVLTNGVDDDPEERNPTAPYRKVEA